MARILDLGTRVELTAIYPHFHDISIGLYKHTNEGGQVQFQVHSYSARQGVDNCLRHIAASMVLLGGMEAAGGNGHTVRFGCGGSHVKACRRVFIEACKVPSGEALQAKPLEIFDKKTERKITLEKLSDKEGFRVKADGVEDGKARRIAAVAGGLAKLADLPHVEGEDSLILFPCSGGHDSLVGLLLVRALNVRAAMREQDGAAGRGVLAAPSAQQQS